MRRLAVLGIALCIAGCAHATQSRHVARHVRSSPLVSSTWPPGSNTANGSAVFARECSACHGAGGSGGPVGPALHAEHARKTYAQVHSIIADPEPPMPKLFPSRLSAADLRDVSAYVESL